MERGTPMRNSWSDFMEVGVADHDEGRAGLRATASEVLDGDVTQVAGLEYGLQTDALYALHAEAIWEWVVDECDQEGMEQSVFDAVIRFAVRYCSPRPVYQPDIDPRHFHAVMVWLAAIAWAAHFRRSDERREN
jgi:hypothetical protein